MWEDVDGIFKKTAVHNFFFLCVCVREKKSNWLRFEFPHCNVQCAGLA